MSVKPPDHHVITNNHNYIIILEDIETDVMRAYDAAGFGGVLFLPTLNAMRGSGCGGCVVEWCLRWEMSDVGRV